MLQADGLLVATKHGLFTSESMNSQSNNLVFFVGLKTGFMVG